MKIMPIVRIDRTKTLAEEPLLVTTGGTPISRRSYGATPLKK